MKDLTRRGTQSRMRDENSLAQSFITYNSNPFTSDELEDPNSDYLRSYWQAVRQNVWLIAGITLFATLAVAVYQFRQPDQYQAQARIEIGHDTSAPGLKENSTGPSDDSVYFNTQLQILNSSALLRRVVKTLDLEHDDSFGHPKQTGQLASRNNNVPPVTVTTSAHDDLTDAKRLEPWVDALTKALK